MSSVHPREPHRSGRSRRRVGPTAYLVPRRDGQPDDHVVVIAHDTMVGDQVLPPGYMFPRDADAALARMGFRRTGSWRPRGTRPGMRCAVSATDVGPGR